MMSFGLFTNVVMIFLMSLHVATEAKERGKYFDHKLNAKVNHHVPRRSGILETVQAMPTSSTPTARVPARGNTSARVNTSANSIKDSARPKLDSVKNMLALKTNFSSLVNDNAASNSVLVQNATNGPQNLASYSLDQPNSFPHPTSIPAIDTMSAAWPTPMGSIDNEMDDVGNPPSLEPIGNEMSSEEKIPGIQGISNMARIPLEFQEEAPWERSHATAGHAAHGHATSSFGHAASRHFVPSPSGSNKKLVLVKSRKLASAHARRRESVAANPRGVAKARNTSLTVNKFRRKGKTQSGQNDKGSQHAGKLSKGGQNKTSKKRVAIPPPKPIDPIQPLLEKFKKEKEVGDIKGHTIDIENVEPNEAIDEHLISLKTPPKIKPIAEHLSKEEPVAIELIANHQLN